LLLPRGFKPFKIRISSLSIYFCIPFEIEREGEKKERRSREYRTVKRERIERRVG